MEKFYTLEDAAKLPWLPKEYTFQTLWRWATGYYVDFKLKTIRIGGALCTTEQWLLDFIQQRDHVENTTVWMWNELAQKKTRATVLTWVGPLSS